MKEKTPANNLDALIQKIKLEGIEEARTKADAIEKEARANASSILEKARQEARDLIEQAQEEIKRREAIAEKSLEQAGRDLIIAVRNAIIGMFHALIKEELKPGLTGPALENLLLKIIEGWQKGGMSNETYEVLLSQQDQKALSDHFILKLREKMKAGLEIKVHPEFESGFRIGLKGEHIWYDFTNESLADLLARYVNPQLARLLKGINAEDRQE